MAVHLECANSQTAETRASRPTRHTLHSAIPPHAQNPYTLKYALELVAGWKVIAGNLVLRIEGDGVTRDTIDEVVNRLSGDAFWNDAGLWKALVARLPEYRLSKFQRALPDASSMDLGLGYMLDAEGTRGYLSNRSSPQV